MNKSQSIKITPLDMTDVKIVVAYKIMNIRVVLNKKAILAVQLLNAENKVVKIEQVVLTGDDYKNWGNDETYVNTCL